MNKQDALKKFYECAANDDLSGCLDALKFVSAATLNKQDGDDYDMLIQETVNENACAVEALLIDGRCDMTHEENLCGLTAFAFAMDYPADSRIYNAFLKYAPGKYIFRNGNLIAKEDIFARIMDGTIEAEENIVTQMLSDIDAVNLMLAGKISRNDFENYIKPDGLSAESQFILLLQDEQYGKKFINWDYLKDNATVDLWIKVLQKYPQYTAHADWDRLFAEGSKEQISVLTDIQKNITQ